MHLSCHAVRLLAAPALLASLWALSSSASAESYLGDPKLREQTSALAYDVRGGSAREFAEFLALEISRY